MKNLTDLLRNTDIIEWKGARTVHITDIRYDSRRISPGDLFVAIKGETYDGHDFIDAAVQQGAAAVVCETRKSGTAVPCIRVGNSRKALALISAAFFGNPGGSMNIIGITGTNGKTSTAYLTESILQAGGVSTGLLGTVAYRIGTESHEAKWTTPESLELHQYLNAMKERHTETVIMEVSSHAIDQHRIEGLSFRLAVFTNLSQDHLDYHRSMEKYTAVKQRLFRRVDPVKGENIINTDDPRSRQMTRENHRPVVTYSMRAGKADVFPLSSEFRLDGTAASLRTPAGDIEIQSPLIGRHNLSNIMAAVCAGICFGLPAARIAQGVDRLELIPGRLEPVSAGQSFSVLVDYAHTPDAMEKVIGSVRPMVKGKLIVLFGCGGDRDRSKRPLMGRIAERGADLAVLTSDNPRTEDPEKIIDDVLTGIENPGTMVIMPDRTAAIHRAIDAAGETDCVLILGKGHETYQILGSRRIHYDDREVAREYLKEKRNQSA